MSKISDCLSITGVAVKLFFYRPAIDKMIVKILDIY